MASTYRSGTSRRSEPHCRMINRTFSSILIVACALALAPVSVARAADAHSQKADALLKPVTSPTAPGMSVMVMQGDEVVFRRAYGLADVAHHIANKPETNFRLASVTKQFTATAIMLLAQDGKLHYNDHLSDFFPEFGNTGRQITIRNLLNHTSGLPDYEDLWDERYASTPKESVPQIHDSEVVQILEQHPILKFAPGSKWEYSNSGYATLAMIVENISGSRFGDFLQRRIFTPLKMQRTIAYEAKRNSVSHRAYGYSRANDTWTETDQSSTSAVLGDGGIYSSVDDLSRWVTAQRKLTLLKPETMKAATTPAPLESGTYPYGFGLFLQPYRDHPRVWHDGSTSGFRTTIQRLTDVDLTVIILANHSDIDVKKLAEQLMDIYLEPIH